MSLVYRVLADCVMVVHFAYVAFVVVGLLLIVLGVLLGWNWVRGFTFRLLHLAAIGLVVAEAILGVVCPLTTWERGLRTLAGQATSDEGFLAGWLHAVMFFRAEPWVFTTAYVVFGLIVLATFVLAPPRVPARLARAKTQHTSEG